MSQNGEIGTINQILSLLYFRKQKETDSTVFGNSIQSSKAGSSFFL